MRLEAGASKDVITLKEQLEVMTDTLSQAKTRQSKLEQHVAELKEQNDFLRQTESHQSAVETKSSKPLESAAVPLEDSTPSEPDSSFETRFRHAERQRLDMEAAIIKERSEFETLLEERDTKNQDLLRQLQKQDHAYQSNLDVMKDLVTEMFQTAMREDMTMADFREHFKTQLK